MGNSWPQSSGCGRQTTPPAVGLARFGEIVLVTPVSRVSRSGRAWDVCSKRPPSSPSLIFSSFIFEDASVCSWERLGAARVRGAAAWLSRKHPPVWQSRLTLGYQGYCNKRLSPSRHPLFLRGHFAHPLPGRLRACQRACASGACASDDGSTRAQTRAGRWRAASTGTRQWCVGAQGGERDRQRICAL